MAHEVTLSLASWQVVFLRQLAHERRTSMSDVVRDLVLKEKLEQESQLTQPALGAEETNRYAIRTAS
jgi:hypothetical protein